MDDHEEVSSSCHINGNTLRFAIRTKYWLYDVLIIVLSPDVEFCGYSIPHPSEPKMNVRIQTYGMASVSCVVQRAKLTLCRGRDCLLGAGERLG